MANLGFFTIVVILCFVSSCAGIQRNIFLRSGTINTGITPDYTSCETQQKFLRDVNEKELRWLLHMSPPIDEEKKNMITDLGIKLGGYIPSNTFIITATREQVEKAKTLSHVFWIGAFLPSYKVSEEFEVWKRTTDDVKAYAPNLLQFVHDSFPNQKDHLQSLEQWGRSLTEQLSMEVMLEKLTSTVALVRVNHPTPSVATLALPQVAQLLSEIHQVTWIEPVMNYSPQSKWSTRLLESKTPVYTSSQTPYQSLNPPLVASGQVVAVVDTGLDTSNCFFANKNVNSDCRFAGTNPQTCTASPGHGTAMAAIIAGNSTTFATYSGLAPGASVTVYPLPVTGTDGTEPTINFLAGQFQPIFIQAATIGARVLVAGFAGTANSYDIFASEVDSNAYLEPYLLVVLPAGNKGAQGVGSIRSPGVSKNALTVGSTQNALAALQADAALPAAQAANINNPKLSGLFGQTTVSTFSSRGPTNDGRIKPDVVAPGEIITTATAGSCSLSVQSGTSFAAATAGAAAAIIRDYFKQSYYGPEGIFNLGSPITAPLAIQIKAMLIASTTNVQSTDAVGPIGSLTNVLSIPTGPTAYGGFGHIQLSNILNLNQSVNFFIDQAPRNVSTGTSQLYCFTALKVGARIKATLVWSDPPSTQGTSFALVNNLDLVVVDRVTGREYRANGLETFDNLNNVEVVQFTVPSSGSLSFMTIVYGTNVPVLSPQVFSVVISGDISIDTSSADCNSARTVSQCPNACSGQGVCAPQGTCACQSGYYGVDCSLNLCSGINCAGADPSLSVSHGVCNYFTGTCVCDPAFTGSDCSVVNSSQGPTVFQGHTTKQTAIAAVLGAIGGLVLGLILGCCISKVVMERQRKKRREQLLKGHQKF